MARSPDTPKKVWAAGVSMSVVAWLPPFTTGWENANDPTLLPPASKTSTWWPSNMFEGHHVDVFDAGGKRVGSFAFSQPVVNGGSQATTLIETPAAQTFFGVSGDLAMTPVIDRAGGKVCWGRGTGSGPVDCVSWGHYTGKPTGAGMPFDSSEGVVSGAAMDRIVSGGTRPNGLDAKDDTDNSAKDFHFAAPAPTNNA